jgi:hypothetical protein
VQCSAYVLICAHVLLCAGAQIAPMEVGRINIQYRRVECTPPEPLNVDINFNYGQGAWLRIVVSVSSDCTFLIPTPMHEPARSAGLFRTDLSMRLLPGLHSLPALRSVRMLFAAMWWSMATTFKC